MQWRKRRRLQLPWRLCAKARAQELHQRHYLKLPNICDPGGMERERAGRRPDAAPDHLDDTVGTGAELNFAAQAARCAVAAMALRAPRRDTLAPSLNSFGHGRRLRMAPLTL